jgi:hypothetical protein
MVILLEFEIIDSKVERMATTASTTLKEHLEDIVRVHTSHPSGTASLVNLFQVHSLIILLLFLRVT